MAPIGETEFVNGMAAMSASGLYGPIQLAAGIVASPSCSSAAESARSLKRSSAPAMASSAASGT